MFRDWGDAKNVLSARKVFAFANGIAGTSPEANNTTATVVGYAVTTFGLLAIVPLIMVGGIMLRSLGFMGAGEVV